MGWTYKSNITDKKVMIAEIRKDLEYAGFEVVRSRCVGKNLWSVIKCVTPDGEIKTTIRLDLLMRDRMAWGHKAMTIDEHPYYYNCPFEYLKFVDLDTKNKKEWADKVIKFHEEKNRPIIVGAMYGLKNCSPTWMNKHGDQVKVTSRRPFLGITSKTNLNVRLNKRILGELVSDEGIRAENIV